MRRFCLFWLWTAAGDAAAAADSEASHAGRERFIEGWLTASLLFCVGPLTILGSLSDGLGGCLLYTSDAADERSRGDFGGGRII